MIKGPFGLVSMAEDRRGKGGFGTGGCVSSPGIVPVDKRLKNRVRNKVDFGGGRGNRGT